MSSPSHHLHQVDLIDMQSFPEDDGQGDTFKYIMCYQDHGIKVCWLEALRNKRKGTVAMALLRIFSFIGPPLILQTDNGRQEVLVPMSSCARVAPISHTMLLRQVSGMCSSCTYTTYACDAQGVQQSGPEEGVEGKCSRGRRGGGGGGG